MKKTSKLLLALPLMAMLLVGCIKSKNSSPVSSHSAEEVSSESVESSESLESSELESSEISESSESSSEESSSESSSESEEPVISYTAEEAINAVASLLGTSVSDYSDEEGPYFITGAAWKAESVTVDQVKAIVPQIMPEGFELVEDWTASQFSDGTEFEGCAYLCGDVVLESAAYNDDYSGTAVTVLQIASYTIA